MYQVLARKWRPRGFDELVGQRHVARTLANAVGGNRVAHAYLFAGLRGTGKTTVARILAKCLNCETGPTPTPCNTCSACTEIAEGRSLDVMEVDAASRTKVEQTRDLMETLNYAPVRDRYKVVIVDEAHMLSKNSFNALLKTLEEPPPHVVFVLATTEIHKILPTILSRCQVFEFRRVSARDLTEHLRKVCDDEGIKIGDAALGRLARAGDGSVRDSLSLLERVVAFCGQEVDDDEVLRVIGAVGSETLAGMLRGLAARDASAMLAVLDRTVDEGHDLTHLWNELIGALRDLMLRAALPGRDDLLVRSAEEAAQLTEAAAGLGREDLTRAFRILAELEAGLKNSSQPRFLFEATLIRLGDLGHLQPIEELLARLEGGETPRPGPAERVVAPPARPAPAPAPAAAPQRPARPATPAPQKKNPVDVSSSSGDLKSRLREALGGKPMLAAILDNAGEVKLEGNALVLSFDASHAALALPLGTPDKRSALEEAATEIAGRPVKLRVEAGDAATGHTATATPATPSPVAPQRSARRAKGPRTWNSPDPQLLEQAKQDPGVRKLLREFGAQVLDIQPIEARAAKKRGPVEEPE